jgi:hypothetical protein
VGSYWLMYCVGRGWIEMEGTNRVIVGLYITPIDLYRRFDLPGGHALHDWVRSARTAGEQRRESENPDRR